MISNVRANQDKLSKVGLLVTAFLLFHCGTGTSKNEGDHTTMNNSESQTEFTAIFDGQSLAGWEGDEKIWRVEDGLLIGELINDELENNTFLIWKEGTPGDFELKTEFRITENGNSGINYRSERVEDIPFALRGYQADMDGKNSYTGQNYEERKRTTLAYRGQKTRINSQAPPGNVKEYIKNNAWEGLEVIEELGDRDSLKTLIRAEDWNSMRLVIRGNRLQHYINEVLMSEVIDEDEVNRKLEGLLGIQIHVGPPMKAEFRNIMYKKL